MIRSPDFSSETLAYLSVVEDTPAPLNGSALALARRGLRALAVGVRRAALYFRAALQVVWSGIGANGRYARQALQRRARLIGSSLRTELFDGQRQLLANSRAAVRHLEALPARRLMMYVIALEVCLALGVLAGLLIVSANVRAYWFGAAELYPVTAPKLLTQLSPKAAYAQAASSSATPTPVPTLAPTPTPLPTELPPVTTVTPLPIDFSTWQPYLPRDGGWNGPGECPFVESVFARAGDGAFGWPTDNHFLAGRNFNWRWHPGLDLSAPLGAPLYAADAGVVVYAGWNKWGFGNLVILDHGNGWHTLYAHQSQINVACGQAVEQGQVIGWSGSTGRSTAPHLHFEMRFGGGWMNPWDYLP